MSYFEQIQHLLDRVSLCCALCKLSVILCCFTHQIVRCGTSIPIEIHQPDSVTFWLGVSDPRIDRLQDRSVEVAVSKSIAVFLPPLALTVLGLLSAVLVSLVFLNE
jgi:hypothetical protein